MRIGSLTMLMQCVIGIFYKFQIFLKDKKPEDQPARPTPPTNLNDFQAQYGPTLERRKAEELQKTLSEELRGSKKKAVDTKLAKAKGQTYLYACILYSINWCLDGSHHITGFFLWNES